MRKKTAFILALILAASCITFGGCSSERSSAETGYEKILMNGYESYDDLRKTNMNDMYATYGSATLCTDKQYVSEGESSMKLELDFTSNSAPVYANTCGFKYALSEYESSFGWIDKISEFGMDIYNADAREYTINFVAVGDKESISFTAGATLAAETWNNVRFQFKPWFFEEDTMITEYRIYIEGITGTDDLTATLYIDNVAVYTGDNVAPKIHNGNENGDEKELLDFDDAGDMDAVLTKCDLPLWGFVPRFSVSYNSSVQIGEKSGVMEARIDRSGTWGLAYTMGNGYDIRLLGSVAEKAHGAKELSIVCRNESYSERQVSLIVESNGVEYAETVYIGSGATKTIALDTSGITVDVVTVRIDSWKASEEGLLYFADLRCRF